MCTFPQEDAKSNTTMAVILVEVEQHQTLVWLLLHCNFVNQFNGVSYGQGEYINEQDCLVCYRSGLAVKNTNEYCDVFTHYSSQSTYILYNLIECNYARNLEWLQTCSIAGSQVTA